MGGDNPPVTVTEFNIMGVFETELSLGNFPTKNESRGGNPLTLYPGWRVKLYLDKLYPGNVYGLNIGIWADTGEVNDISTLMSALGYPDDIPEFQLWTPLLIMLIAVLAIAVIYRRRLHKQNPRGRKQ